MIHMVSKEFERIIIAKQQINFQKKENKPLFQSKEQLHVLARKMLVHQRTKLQGKADWNKRKIAKKN